MNIVLNGEAYDLRTGATVSALLEQRELVGQRLAVEVNEEVVPRSEYSEFRLHDGDQVEIVRAIGGG